MQDGTAVSLWGSKEIAASGCGFCSSRGLRCSSFGGWGVYPLCTVSHEKRGWFVSAKRACQFGGFSMLHSSVKGVGDPSIYCGFMWGQRTGELSHKWDDFGKEGKGLQPSLSSFPDKEIGRLLASRVCYGRQRGWRMRRNRTSFDPHLSVQKRDFVITRCRAMCPILQVCSYTVG